MENKDESDVVYFNDYFDDWYYADQCNNDTNISKEESGDDQ
jgi:hypothetical protein